MFEALIEEIYGHVPSPLVEGLNRILRESGPSPTPRALWDETDMVLITYADQVSDSENSPLEAQRRFLLDHGLEKRIACVHLLPFCPYSSDDGFSVIDYMAVDPDAGDWDDIAALGKDFDLMFDLVLNHSSQHHEWFQRFLREDPGYETFYIDQDPESDLSSVVRPRRSPLLTKYETQTGTKHVWTTFSADQVDLNYSDPRVLLAMTETIVEYARRGARIIRLDAIAFLWKEAGTSSIHLRQTHAIVRLMRAVLDQAVPGTIVLTETNVPHKENLSYFGDGHDEAHMVYQFSLPPLLLDALHSGDTSYLSGWLKTLSPPTEDTTFFNFTASHDGVGVRPLEGLVPPERLNRLVSIVQKHGGRVSMRANPDGTESPYELNITYLNAVADQNSTSAAEHARRFLATQAIMLSMQGVPAVYFHSLVGTPNDQQGVADSGQNRRINRHKYQRAELDACFSDMHGLQRRVFDGYQKLLEIRRAQVAFHPNASQEVLDLPTDGWVGFVRAAKTGAKLYVVANLSSEARNIDWDQVCASEEIETPRWDLLAEESLNDQAGVPFRPYQVRWMVESIPA